MCECVCVCACAYVCCMYMFVLSRVGCWMPCFNCLISSTQGLPWNIYPYPPNKLSIFTALGRWLTQPCLGLLHRALRI